MSVFVADPNFCSLCGTILSMKSGSCSITCINCGHRTDLSEMVHVPRTTRKKLNAPATRSSEEEGEKKPRDKVGPTAERVCQKCGYNRLSYITLQLRSADEGQTVIYTCPKCSTKEIENS